MVPFMILIFQKSPSHFHFFTMTKNLKHCSRLPPAVYLPPPPSLLPAINARSPTVHDVVIGSPASLRRQPSERRFLPARRRGGSSANILHLRISYPLTSSASPLPPVIDINYIEPIRRGEGEYFVWFASYLTQNSPRDVPRDGVCCSSVDLSSQNCGGLPTPPLPDWYRS
jgi:hypothetical protein